MTQFTSFVAVEEMTLTDQGEPRKIEVPVEMPEGVSHEGVFGKGDKPFEKLQLLAQLQRAPRARKAPAGGGGGGGSRTTSVAASKGELPRMSTPRPASPQTKARARKDSSSGSADGIGRGGVGGGDGSGTGSQLLLTPNAGLTLAESLGMASKADRLSPEEQKRREFLSKVNPSIAAVIDRLKNKGQPSGDEAKFVRNGKAEIQVWLTDKSPEVIAQLKQLGFEVGLDPKTAKMIIGRLPIEKLAALAELKSVRYVAPMTST